MCGKMSPMIPRHWSVRDELAGADLRKWVLEERINFGIGEEHISAEALREEWNALEIDPWKRKALALALE